MNLVQQAEQDLSFILEDVDNGFAVAITFKNSSDVDTIINCQTTDIGFFVDMQTMAGVVGRTVEITARLSTLLSSDIPEITNDTFIYYTTTAGVDYKMKVIEPMYDRKIGLVKMAVEVSK